MNDNYKRYSEYFLLTILIIIPKIDLINFEDIWQGIRLEDLVVLYLLYILIYYKKVAINKEDVGYNFIIYFFILFISCLIAFMYFDQKWILIIRYIEYIVVIIYFNRNLINIETIFKILKLYLLINLVMVILQHLSLIGEFSSIGYESPFEKTDDRPTGLAGGPWELANCTAIIFFCLLMDKKQSKYSKYLYSLIALFLIYMTHSRTVILALSIVLVFYTLQNHVSRRQLIPGLLILLLGSLIGYFYIFQVSNIDSVYSQIPKLLIEGIGAQGPINYDDLDGRLWSVAIRINHWLEYYGYYTTNVITQIFGVGALGFYMESTPLRILFGTGIVGVIFVIYSIRTIPMNMLLYLFISGLTLDLMMSFKIFFTVFIYFYLIKNIGYENRN